MKKTIIKRKLNTSSLVGFIILSIIIPCCIFFYENFNGGCSFGNDSKPITFFLSNPTWLIWLFMAFIQITFCINIIPFLIFKIMGLLSRFKFDNKELWKYIILVVLFFLATLLPNLIAGHTHICDFVKSNFVYHFSVKIYILIGFGYLAVLVCIFALLLLNSILVKGIKDNFQDYIYLKDRLIIIINILGVILTTSTIATGILHKAVNNENVFPAEFVFLYGLFNTFFIALIFLPVYFKLNNMGKIIVENKLKKIPSNTEAKTFLEEKKTLEELFQTKEDYISILKKVIPILAPLLTSLLDFSGLK